ncbi:hypothetical protein NQ314_007152 [Rhamnusium bicolor]|uniref:Nuclease HARBI1 n=1 Tax=Rhamnusium bicolor TaxID=1586634 RepID=A0AAV8YRL0_9CUCU|nr:hypothetical protein NQ314_007152 [Rhamnusium bicolor]
MNQLLTCFYASDGHISSLADFSGMDISTVSRIVVRVSKVIARLDSQYVKRPETNSIIRKQNMFYRVAGFPQVFSLIDGIHIRIQSPGGNDAEVFRNSLVIIATVVLYNFAKEMNEPEPPASDEINLEELNYLIEVGQMPTYRSWII